MTSRYQPQFHGASSLAVRLPSLPDCHAPYLLGHRDPIASRAPFIPRQFALQSLLAHIHSQPLKHVCNHLANGLHHLLPILSSAVVAFNGNTECKGLGNVRKVFGELRNV